MVWKKSVTSPLLSNDVCRSCRKSSATWLCMGRYSAAARGLISNFCTGPLISYQSSPFLLYNFFNHSCEIKLLINLLMICSINSCLVEVVWINYTYREPSPSVSLSLLLATIVIGMAGLCGNRPSALSILATSSGENTSVTENKLLIKLFSIISIVTYDLIDLIWSVNYGLIFKLEPGTRPGGFIFILIK